MGCYGEFQKIFLCPDIVNHGTPPSYQGGLTRQFLVCEVDAFYLKYLLWIPPPHWINIARLCYYFFAGIPAVREFYQYVADPECKRVGAQTWLIAASILTELLLVFKFGRGEFPNPAPKNVVMFWAFLLVGLVVYPIWRFWWPSLVVNRSEKSE